MPGSLYVVSTPIGNLDDITLRALSILKSVGLIAAEDTRRTAILLRHFGISTPATSLHEHNERQKLPRLLEKLRDGVDIALVSDAGTPVVADPGQALIAAAADSGIRVVPIPGASALLSALAVTGFGANEFIFKGFAPARSHDRVKWLSQLNEEPRVIVLFEAPHRILRTLRDMGDILVERPIIIARELTKIHEEIIRTTVGDVARLQPLEKGEFTIVLGPVRLAAKASLEVDDRALLSHFDRLTESVTLTRRQAVAETAKKFGLSTNEVYSRVERSKGEPSQS
jgi:16S rRNA (cytidine1402-2'-O)-methyltransferase